MLKKVFFLLTIIFIFTLLVACADMSQSINELSEKGQVAVEDIQGEVVEEVDNIEKTIDEELSDTSNKESDDKSLVSEKDEISIEEQVLLDNEGVIITLKSLNEENLFGPSLRVLVDNNRDEDITVQTRNSAVNGVMIESMFSCDVVAGKKANDEITFMSSDLETAQIDTIKDIEFLFYIFNSESWNEIFTSDTINIKTSADEKFVQSYDDSGFIVLDQNGFKIVIKKLDSEDSFWGADIYLYIENNSYKDATIQIRDTSINGFMMDPIFSSDVLAGKKVFSSITFSESDLQDNDIESIDNMEFYFHIFEMEGWDKIFDSELIKVSFNN